MKKFIGGKYVTVNSAAVPAAIHRQAGAVQVSAEVKKPVIQASTAAQKFMDKHTAIDWSGIKGTGKDGQVTKPDAEKFLRALDAQHA